MRADVVAVILALVLLLSLGGACAGTDKAEGPATDSGEGDGTEDGFGVECPESEATACEEYEDDVFLCEYHVARCFVPEFCHDPSNMDIEGCMSGNSWRWECRLIDSDRARCRRFECVAAMEELAARVVSGELECDDITFDDLYPDSCQESLNTWSGCADPGC